MLLNDSQSELARIGGHKEKVEMRVVSGKAKGRKLKGLPGTKTRPILDRVKTALFDLLRPTLEQTFFLDLFAGSGSVGIEALSQGAAKGVFIEHSRQACEVIKANLEHTGLSDQALVKQSDSFRYLRNCQKRIGLS